MTAVQTQSFMVVGGGIAGLTAALDFARLGYAVHLVEKSDRLGGQVGRLDKLYPTDHCAFCPLWTLIRQCKEHPLITIHTDTEVKNVEKEDNGFKVKLLKASALVDEEKCVFCGRCETRCPVSPVPAIRPVQGHVYPPVYRIDKETCTRCGECEKACPTGAIRLKGALEDLALNVANVVWATGFQESDLSRFEELGYGSHPDIMGSLEFETWISEGGPNQGTLRRRSVASVPATVAFIQCVGARDKRHLAHCSAVCCMHALKQAHWIQKRHPEIRCTIFFTDLRTVGKHFYAYAQACIESAAIELVRGRPASISPAAGGKDLLIKFENTMTRKVEHRVVDMVVLNGALQPNSVLEPTGRAVPRKFDESTGSPPALACGFCKEPADMIESVMQASSAVLKACTGLKAKR